MFALAIVFMVVRPMYASALSESFVWNLLARSRAVSSPMTTAHSESPPLNLPSIPRAASPAARANVGAGGGVAPIGQAAVRGSREEARELRSSRAVSGKDLLV